MDYDLLSDRKDLQKEYEELLKIFNIQYEIDEKPEGMDELTYVIKVCNDLNKILRSIGLFDLDLFEKIESEETKEK